MFGFFNQKSAWRAGMQAYHALAFTYAAYELYTNPTSLAENGLTMFVSAVSGLSLSEHNNIFADLGGAALNTTQIGAVYNGVTSGCTLVPGLFNAVKTVGSLVSTGVSVFTSCPDEPSTASAKLN
ncbi:hypothetical protein [Legionella tunisiensis]|uniref:hypothetical protein n=1 Tax=Legionella tunisiensis TaxID=1034944 RepID=UPI0002F9B2CD|nr:hypothetical protein [Legionella tunisiensis]